MLFADKHDHYAVLGVACDFEGTALKKACVINTAPLCHNQDNLVPI